jgi:hypothetical protein
MKSIIVDLSCASDIKILNVRITSVVSVLSGFHLTLAPSDDPLRAAAVKLRDEGLLELPAIIIPPLDLVKKHNFRLLKMPDKEIRRILPLEIASEEDSSAAMVFNYLRNDLVEEKQVEKVEITAFYCPRQTMLDFIERLKAEGIRPTQIIPRVQGLKTLVEINPTFGTERTGAAFLELMESRIALNIFRKRYWDLERNFLFRMEGDEGSVELSAEDFTSISTELNRIFQSFKQRSRGCSIDRVILYGTGSHNRHLKNMINDSQSVTAFTIEAEHFGKKVSFPSHLRDSNEFVSTFALPISVALSVCRKRYLDLFPVESKEQVKLFSRMIGLTISAAIIGAILVGSTIYFEGIKGSYRHDIGRLEGTYQSMSRNADIILDTKKKRADFYKRRYYIDFPIQYSYSAANLIRKLSLIADDRLELLKIEINPTNQTFKFKLDGRIEAGNQIRAQSRFLEFYQKLKEFDDIIQVTSSRAVVNKAENQERLESNKAPGAAAPDSSRREVILYFTVNGEIEPE